MGEAQPPGPSSVPLGVRHPHHPQPGTSLPHAESRRPSRLLQRASPRKAAGLPISRGVSFLGSNMGGQGLPHIGLQFRSVRWLGDDREPHGAGRGGSASARPGGHWGLGRDGRTGSGVGPSALLSIM